MRRKPILLWVAILGSAIIVPANAQWENLFKKAKDATGKSQSAKQIAHFAIRGPLAEEPVGIPSLFGGEPPQTLKSLLERFKQARRDNDVVAVVLDLQGAALGLGQLEEIHAALEKFAAVDKPVYVHADSLSTITYAAATGASEISLVPTGDVWLLGLYGEAPYLRGLLDKIGCVPDFEKFEDYKTASETFMRSGPSEQSREMTNWLLDDLYAGVVKQIATARGMSEDKVRTLIDNGPYNADQALAAGLIDAVQHRQDFVAGIHKRYGDNVKVITDYGDDQTLRPPDDPFAMFSFFMQMLNPSPKTYSKPTVAIVYVAGAIQMGVAKRSPFGGSSGAFSTTIRKALDTAARDDTIEAVVMRVDSPGGSALASEIILDAAQRVAKEKPLIVSMGNVAGSGGYYVSCNADTIFADAMTITASIGVLGGKIVTTGMWDKLGINWHANQRGKMAAMMSTGSTFSDAERAKIRGYMGNTYRIFKAHVVSGRGDRLTKPINKIAGGRVFTGRQALELGLVDKIGGLDDAIKFAAKKAGLGEYEIRVLPEPPGFFDLLTGSRDDEYSWTRVARSALLETPTIRAGLMTLSSIDPLRVRAVVRALQRIELVHDEGVIMMMPEELLIR